MAAINEDDVLEYIHDLIQDPDREAVVIAAMYLDPELMDFYELTLEELERDDVLEYIPRGLDFLAQSKWMPANSPADIVFSDNTIREVALELRGADDQMTPARIRLDSKILTIVVDDTVMPGFRPASVVAVDNPGVTLELGQLNLQSELRPSLTADPAEAHTFEHSLSARTKEDSVLDIHDVAGQRILLRQSFPRNVFLNWDLEVPPLVAPWASLKMTLRDGTVFQRRIALKVPPDTPSEPNSTTARFQNSMKVTLNPDLLARKSDWKLRFRFGDIRDAAMLTPETFAEIGCRGQVVMPLSPGKNKGEYCSELEPYEIEACREANTALLLRWEPIPGYNPDAKGVSLE